MTPCFSLLLISSHVCFPLKLHLNTGKKKDFIIDIPNETPDNTEFEIELPEDKEADNHHNNKGFIIHQPSYI